MHAVLCLLQVIRIPTALPLARRDYPDAVYRTKDASLKALVREVAKQKATGRPVLIGTTSVSMSERIAQEVSRFAEGWSCLGPSLLALNKQSLIHLCLVMICVHLFRVLRDAAQGTGHRVQSAQRQAGISRTRIRDHCTGWPARESDCQHKHGCTRD